MRRKIKNKIQRASILLIAFVLLASLVLFVFIRRVLVKPVLEIGEVTQSVGNGNLEVMVDHRSKDEVGDLASTVNEMILGLRSKGMMERFVGDHTRRMIDESIRGSADHKMPVRRRVAILFSDVRGFTSYAERREPEQVIRTLNLYLGVQAEVVQGQGGYVDKFVGDEIMAIFEGENMEARAVAAAQEMMSAVQSVKSDDKMEIGIGIAAGDVVFGAMGATGRQDYTVIGDVVNLAARLCSASGAGLIMVSEEIQSQTAQVISYSAAKQLSVKGKANPVIIYEVS